jgi:hypothetical protein
VAGAAAGDAEARPPSATSGSSFIVSLWPCGHGAGASDSVIDRRTSKVSPQVRQLKS